MNNPTSQAVILVGGRGARLGSLTHNIPKPMMDVSGQPFIQLLIEEVARHGFQDIILLCGHLAEKICDSYEGRLVLGARVRCVVEAQPMGTGGALLNASHLLDDCFLLLNGDSFFGFNFLDLGVLAADRDWLGKVALRSLPDTGRYGRVSVDGDRLTSFSEKASSGPGLINGGVYMLSKGVLDYIDKTPCSLEHNVLPRLIEKGLLFGRAYNGYFIDIGIPEDLRRAQSELPKRRLPAIFFDRDGVLNYDKGYTHRIEEFLWVDGAIEAIKLFNDFGWLVVVVTNQAGIARGLYASSAVECLHTWMQAQLREKGAHVDAFYYCPHHPEGNIQEFAKTCGCRKPEPGMLTRAFSDWPINQGGSYLIGDKLTDLEAADRAGIRAILYDGSVGLLQLSRRILGI